MGEGRSAGGTDLAKVVLEILSAKKANFKPLYDTRLPIKLKIEMIATQIYRADGVDFAPAADRAAKQFAEFGLAETPVCIAKTPDSFTDNAAILGAPTGFRLTIRDIYPSAGAGFVVALAGDIMTMPGLSKVPAAEKMRIGADGTDRGTLLGRTHEHRCNRSSSEGHWALQPGHHDR